MWKASRCHADVALKGIAKVWKETELSSVNRHMRTASTPDMFGGISELCVGSEDSITFLETRLEVREHILCLAQQQGHSLGLAPC